MLDLTIPDRTCGGCGVGVRQAVKSVDANATLLIDPSARKVQVSTIATDAAVISAITEAGFSPV